MREISYCISLGFKSFKLNYMCSDKTVSGCVQQHTLCVSADQRCNSPYKMPAHTQFTARGAKVSPSLLNGIPRNIWKIAGQKKHEFELRARSLGNKQTKKPRQKNKQRSQ